MRKRLVQIIVTLLGLAATGMSAVAAELVIPGSGDCEFILNRLAAEFEKAQSGRRVHVPPSTGSTGGVKAVLQNEAVLARIARPLKAEEAQAGLKSAVFARDAVVFAVGEKVTVKSLTAAQLADLFGGRVGNWREVGGEPGPVRLVVREEGESSIVQLRARLEPFRTLKMGENAKMVAKTGEMIELLTRYKTSIGWATNSSVLAAGTALRPLALDGTSATAALVASGKYPVATEYALVYREERLNAEAREFLAFVRGAAAQDLLRKLGVSPAGRG